MKRVKIISKSTWPWQALATGHDLSPACLRENMLSAKGGFREQFVSSKFKVFSLGCMASLKLVWEAVKLCHKGRNKQKAADLQLKLCQ